MLTRDCTPKIDVRQCILYDSPEPNARLIGIEYMISPKLYATLPPEERRYWHSHVFEVKSGMLIMPQPSVVVPEAAWEKAETKEMEDVVELYGKVFHLWQTDRGDRIPLGEPQLMTSFTAGDQFDFEKNVGDRDRRFGSDYKRKQAARSYIKEPELHPGTCCVRLEIGEVGLLTDVRWQMPIGRGRRGAPRDQHRTGELVAQGVRCSGSWGKETCAA